MAYVEIRKNGKVVTRREVDQAKAHSGICVRLGKGKRVEVAIGRPGSVGKYDVEVFEGAPGGDETLPGGPKRRDDAAASLSVQQSSAEEAFPHVEGYRITGRLGEGGMGTVWHARQLGTNRDVALKLLGKGAFASERARHRFEREVELCARLEHPCIAGIYDSGVHRGVYYYAMEHIRGVHLDQYVRQNDLSDNEVLSLMQAVCQAVQHAHQRGVIHRDLKPSNVMVSEDGRPHVLDFGLARTFQDEDKGYTISVEGEIAGTPAYMAPEQAAGRHGEMDTRTDVYTLGVILFKLLTGESPHEMTGSRYDLIRRIVEGEPRRPRDVREGLDREIESLLVKAMAKDPAERYASAGDLAADIGNYLSGDPLRARPATTWYFLRKRVRKYRGRVALAAALAVALIGVAVWAYVRVAQERDRAEAARIVAGQERDRAEQQRARAEGEQARAEREKTRAEQEKTRAEREKAGAVLARQKEAEQRKKAEAALRTAQEESYYNTIALAAKKIDDRAYDQARALLAGTQPEIRSWEWGRLAFLCRRDVMTFTPPAGAIVGLAPAQGGGFRVAVTKIITKWAGRGVNRHKETVAHELAVFDPASGKSLWTRRIEESYRPYARLSPAGQFLVRSWPIVTFWHADTGQQKKQFDQPAVYQVGAISPDGSRLLARVRPAVYKNMDRRSSPLSVVDTGSGAVLCTFDKLKSFHFRDAAFSPKGRKVLLLINQSVRRSSKTHYWSLAEIYDTSTGRLARAIPRQNDLAQNGAWSPDGQSVAATVGTRIVVWNAETGREVKAFDYPQGRPYRLAFSPDSRSLAVSGADAVVRLYDVASGSEVRRFEGHTDGILNLAFSRDGSQLATASNNVAKVWNVKAGAVGDDPIQLEAGHNIAQAVFSRDGKRLLAATIHGSVRQHTSAWDVLQNQKLLTVTVKGLNLNAYQTTVVPDANLLVAVNGQFRRSATAWDIATGQERATFGPHKLRLGVERLVPSPDGRYVLAGTSSEAALWDTKTGRSHRSLSPHPEWVRRAAFSGDGQTVATSSGGKIFVWDVAGGKKKAQIAASGEPILTHDGGRVLGIIAARKGAVFAVKDGKRLAVLSGLTDTFHARFTRDGRRVVAGEGSVLRVWNAQTGREIVQLAVPLDGTPRLAFAPDGRRLALFSGNQVIFWDARDWTQSLMK